MSPYKRSTSSHSCRVDGGKYRAAAHSPSSRSAFLFRPLTRSAGFVAFATLRGDDGEKDRNNYVHGGGTERYNDRWVPIYRLAARYRGRERKRGIGPVRREVSNGFRPVNSDVDIGF
jgi:hypothetical protein